MTPQPPLFDPEDVDKLVFYHSVLLGGPWGHVHHSMAANLIWDGDFIGELVGQIGMNNEVNLAWTVALPNTTVQSYLASLLTIELKDESYHPEHSHTGWYPTRRLEVTTSQETIAFRNDSQNQNTVTPWAVTRDKKVQVSHDKAPTNVWQLLFSALWIEERTKALFDAWEEFQKPKPPKRKSKPTP